MLRVFHLPLVLVAAILLASTVAYANDVVVHMRDGRRVEGELLVVCDTALVLTLGGRTVEPVSFPFDSIRRVDVKGSSYWGLGAFAGLVMGASIGASSADKSGFMGGLNAIGPAIGGGLSGALIGGLIGSSVSTGDTSIVAGSSPGSFLALKTYARLPQ